MMRWGGCMLLAVACSEPESGAQRARLAQPIELSELGDIFALSLNLLPERTPGARVAEEASLATGALLVPFIDAAGEALLAADGSRIRGTCGGTLVSPSFAVTAAHCVDSTAFDLDGLVLELYRPTPLLAESYLAATTLTGAFPNYQHATLTDADGYLVDRYPCNLVARCSDGYGGRVDCPAVTAGVEDAALVRCEGRPGDKYGFLDVAASDEPGTALFMPWKHEIYDVPQDPLDDRFQHYTVLPAQDYASNFHYFGALPDGREHNQLLPLISVPFPDGTPHSRLSSTESSTSTDLSGCHGTSGSGVLQQAMTGEWQLLGPGFGGNPEHEDYLCNHVPSLDGMQRGPGSLGLSYANLQITQATLATHREALDVDCEPQGSGDSLLSLRRDCWRRGLESVAGVAGLFTQAGAGSPWLSRAESVLRIAPGGNVTLRLNAGPSAAPHRFGLLGKPDDSCSSAGCATIVAEAQGAELLRYELGTQGSSITSLAASPIFVDGESLEVVLSASGEVAVEVAEIVLRSEGAVNGFATAKARLEAALVDLSGSPTTSMPGASPPGPIPMRFIGDGAEGFAAQLLPQERMLLVHQAMPRGHRWSSRFRVQGAALRCGLLDSEQQLLMDQDCSAGLAHFDDTAATGPALEAFYIEVPTDSSPAVLDDLVLVSDAALDTDGDLLPDVVDDCPRGPAPASTSLEVTTPTPLEIQVCVPLPTAVALEPPTATNACDPAVFVGALETIHGVDVSELAIEFSGSSPTVELPLGEHRLRWEARDTAGNVYATVPQTVAVSYLPGRNCCSPEQTTIVTDGSPLAITRTETAQCVLGAQDGDLALLGASSDWLSGGGGDDYLAGGGGTDVLVGGDGDDYLGAGRSGLATLIGGAGNDTVHATLAARAILYGGPGDDVLVGSSGDDEFYPGPGSGVALGGAGADRFIFYDVCELERGLRLIGGDGPDEVRSPIDEAALAAAGIELVDIEAVTVDATQTYLSDCYGGAR